MLTVRTKLAKQDRETYQKQAKELSERKQELEREQNEISASLKGSNQDLELGERRLKDAEAGYPNPVNATPSNQPIARPIKPLSSPGVRRPSN